MEARLCGNCTHWNLCFVNLFKNEVSFPPLERQFTSRPVRDVRETDAKAQKTLRPSPLDRHTRWPEGSVHPPTTRAPPARWMRLLNVLLKGVFAHFGGFFNTIFWRLSSSYCPKGIWDVSALSCNFYWGFLRRRYWCLWLNNFAACFPTVNKRDSRRNVAYPPCRRIYEPMFPGSIQAVLVPPNVSRMLFVALEH